MTPRLPQEGIWRFGFHGLSYEYVATIIGFSALDGLPMGTRCGVLDPGVVLYRLQEKGMDAEALEPVLYHQSGLLGVSGLSSDVRRLLASGEPRARDAIDFWSTARNAKWARWQPPPGVWTRWYSPLELASIRLDSRCNVAVGPRISTPDRSVSVWVIPTNEELMVARRTFTLTHHQ